eukprot:354955-Chlamydomonas_euryale.AAC.1
MFCVSLTSWAVPAPKRSVPQRCAACRDTPRRLPGNRPRAASDGAIVGLAPRFDARTHTHTHVAPLFPVFGKEEVAT